MASISVTYTFVNATVASATEVNTNFTDLINGTNDGTKDFNIAGLTVNGNGIFNGNVTLGNASGDDITITGSIAGSIPVKANATYDFGSATMALRSIYLGNASSFTVRLLASASQASTYTITWPTSVGVAGQFLSNTGSGVLAWTDNNGGAQDFPVEATNYTVTAAVGSSALTLALKTKAGSDASSTDPIYIAFRNATAATGDYTVASVTGALSLVISSGSTLGHLSGEPNYIYLYAINNAGTVVLGASTTPFDELSVASTTAEGGAGAADSATVMYSTAAQSNKAIRLIARLKSSQATAGTWASVPTEISLTNKTTNVSNLVFGVATSDFRGLTIMGKKQYEHGTNYSGGNAPTVTVTGGTVTRATFVPYFVDDGSTGAWRLKINIDTSCTSTTSVNITVNGVTFKNGPNQALSFMGDTVTAARAFTNSNASTIGIGTSSAVTAIRVSGDVELNSKPTWAY